MSTEQQYQEACEMVTTLRAAYETTTVAAKRRKVAEDLDWWIGRKASLGSAR